MGERKVKTLGKLAILLGLSIGLSASERGQISFASPVAARPQPSARLSSPAQTAGALAVLAGGDSCATATLISAFPFGDSDNTTGKSSDVNTVSSSCIHPDFNRVAGPDLVYQFTSNGTTSLKFTLTPTNSSYDPAIYVLGACGIGTSCGVGSDFGFEGEVEVIGPVILPAGTYFLYVDSYFASEAECDPFINPGCSAGPYNLSIVAGLTTPTPSVTRTPTITRTPTNTATPTNTGTSTPTATPTRTPTPSPTPTSTPNGGITATPTPTPTTTVTPTSTATPAPATRFFTLAPCRVVDTRDAVGPYGGPPLAGGSGRAFTMVGRCGIESGALAVSLNVTVLQPTAAGYLTLYPAGGDLPLASTINYRVDQVRANNAIVRLGPGGNLAVYSGQGGGNVHLIIDVNGFFR